jgi:hypothetical protein
MVGVKRWTLSRSSRVELAFHISHRIPADADAFAS